MAAATGQRGHVRTCAHARRTGATTSGQDGLVTAPNIRRQPEFMLCMDFKAFEMSKLLIQSPNHFCYTLEGILGY